MFLLQQRTITGQRSESNFKGVTTGVYKLLCDCAHRWRRVEGTIVNGYTYKLSKVVSSGWAFHFGKTHF
jgi:hypothetical protein